MIKTFCDPFLEERYDCHLRPGDIDNALKAFGPGLVKLYINPMYLEGKAKINYIFPEELQVEGHAGVAGWELMGEISEKVNFNHLANTPDNLNIFKATDKLAEEKRKGTKIPQDKTPAGQLPQKTGGESFQDTPDKQPVAKSVKTSLLGSPEHPSKSDELQDLHSRRSNGLGFAKNRGGRPLTPLQTDFLEILQNSNLTLQEKGEKLGLHYSTVQRRIKNLEKMKREEVK